jgi:hypothetical protein
LILLAACWVIGCCIQVNKLLLHVRALSREAPNGGEGPPTLPTLLPIALYHHNINYALSSILIKSLAPLLE